MSRRNIGDEFDMFRQQINRMSEGGSSASDEGTAATT